jgi:hypothetical protein
VGLVACESPAGPDSDAGDGAAAPDALLDAMPSTDAVPDRPTDAIPPPDDASDAAPAPTPVCGTSEPTPIDPDAPLFVYYGAYGSSAGQRATLALVTSGAGSGGEAILALNREPRRGCDPPWPDLALWRERGGKIAHVLGENRGSDELRALLARPDGVTEIIETFHAGFHYMAIDEVAMNDPGWVDGGDLANGFSFLVEELARRGYDRRVILYINSYNIVTADRVRDYGQVLGVCRDHCRALASEVYIRTVHVMDAPRYDICHGNTDCFETALRRFENVAPGISSRTISILGLSTNGPDGPVHYDDPTHPYPLCEGPGAGGALRRQYRAATVGPFGSLSPGIGAYTLAPVPHPGFSERQGECIMAENAGRAWPRAL